MSILSTAWDASLSPDGWAQIRGSWQLGYFCLVFAPQGGPGEPEIFTSYFFAVLLPLRGFLPGLAVFAPAPTMAKSSRLLPPFIAAVSHRGLRPRPAQVSAGFSGLRY